MRDSGPGIAPDQIAHVFERFYQVDESTTRTQPGTGIGLSLVKELVELHGGSIVVESASDETTFTATFPPLVAAAEVAVADAAEIAEPASLPHVIDADRTDHPAEFSEEGTRGEDVPTLLVVDDSADLRSYIRDHFTARFRVLEAANGAEGIALARRHLPDVVLSDVMMPAPMGESWCVYCGGALRRTSFPSSCSPLSRMTSRRSRGWSTAPTSTSSSLSRCESSTYACGT